ncbi:AraC family transcriptional regulator [Halomonas aestuarii]|uniref:AraC family transcriptional regulator n=1 Tax=Halomonas aestuarii TaxID=1897729 RepID=A0A1J0VD52_9GAMM|nr:helix-turn-helix domain-containing protein [Halomonas aestuarii]APE29914.1 AraC family transcriptional regulator [Halomonas aestuarii]
MTSAIRQIPLDTTIHHHAHDFHQIVIGLRGEAQFEIEGLGGSISAFSGCIVPANHLHSFAGTRDNHQLVLDMPRTAFAMTGHQGDLVRLFDAPRFFALDSALRHYLEFLRQELRLLARDGHVPPLHQERLAGTLLGALHARLASEPATSGRRLDLAALDRFIDRHLGDPLRVADLAAEACLSEAHFRERFRQRTGLSPWQYVTRRRLESARHWIQQSRLPLSEIAELTGFTSLSALSRAHRQAFGQPPSQLRRDRRGRLSQRPALADDNA